MLVPAIFFLFVYPRLIQKDFQTLFDYGVEKSDFVISSVVDELGNEKSYLNYVDYYKNKADFEGIDPIIAGVLNKLYGGLSSALFHGIIRVSYSLQSQNEDETLIIHQSMRQCLLPEEQ